MTVAVYQRRLKAVGLQTVKLVAAQWAQVPDFAESRREPFARKVAPIVANGQIKTANITAAYVAQAARLKPFTLRPAQIIGEASRPIDPIEEYMRPFGVAGWAESNGADFETAKKSGLARLTDLSTMDMFLAARTASTIIDLATPAIVGWTRVADAGACSECSAADGLDMDAAGDMAGHPGCGCSSEPKLAGDDPSEAADPEAFDVHDHGELGPVLSAA